MGGVRDRGRPRTGGANWLVFGVKYFCASAEAGAHCQERASWSPARPEPQDRITCTSWPRRGHPFPERPLRTRATPTRRPRGGQRLFAGRASLPAFVRRGAMNGAQRPSEAASHQVLFNLVERQGVVVADARRAHQLSRLQGLERVQAVGRRTLVVPARSLQHQALPFRCPPESVLAPFVDDQWVSPDAGRRADSDTVVHSTQRAGGSAGVDAGGNACVTQTEGGVSQETRGGCQATPFHFLLSLFWFFVLDRPTRTAPAERDVTGATPPFVPLARHGEVVGVSHGVRHRVSPHSPSGRSLPSVCIPAIWTPPSTQGFYPSWKGEIRRSLLACGWNCASTCRVLTGTGTKTRGDEPTADLYSASELETSVSGPP